MSYSYNHESHFDFTTYPATPYKCSDPLCCDPGPPVEERRTLPPRAQFDNIPGQMSIDSLLKDRMYMAGRNWFTQDDIDAVIRLREKMTDARTAYVETRPCYHCTDDDHKTAMHWTYYDWMTGKKIEKEDPMAHRLTSPCTCKECDTRRAEKVENLLQEKWKRDMDTTPVMKNITIDGPCGEPWPSVDIQEMGHDDAELREKALVYAIDIKTKNLAANLDLTALTKMVHNWLLKGTL